MNVREPIYETKISDSRWWANDIPGNAGWIAYLVCLVKSMKSGRRTHAVNHFSGDRFLRGDGVDADILRGVYSG